MSEWRIVLVSGYFISYNTLLVYNPYYLVWISRFLVRTSPGTSSDSSYGDGVHTGCGSSDVWISECIFPVYWELNIYLEDFMKYFWKYNVYIFYLPVCLSSDSVKNSSLCSLSLIGFRPIHSSPVVSDMEARRLGLQLVVNSMFNQVWKSVIRTYSTLPS